MLKAKLILKTLALKVQKICFKNSSKLKENTV